MRAFINEFYECGVRCLEAAQGDIWEMLGQSFKRSLALCRDQRRADFIRNIMECSSREALTFRYIQLRSGQPARRARTQAGARRL